MQTSPTEGLFKAELHRPAHFLYISMTGKTAEGDFERIIQAV